MALAFPAYHTERISAGVETSDARNAIKESIIALSWTLEEEREDGFVVLTDMNFKSFGERVSIDLLPDNTIQILSKCVLKTQCVDWGKNKGNITKFITAYRHKARLTMSVEL